MASITFTIDDTIVQRVLDGFALANGYTGTDPSGNAETKTQFLRRKVIEHIRRDVSTAETSTAAATAANNAAAQIIVT